MYQAVALQQYQNIGVQAGFMDASPHKVVDLLLQGAIDRLCKAKCYALRNNRAMLGESVSNVLAIIGALRSGLNKDRGGQVSENLLALYDYMESRLLEANFSSEIEIFDEVSALLSEISAGWKSIPVDLR